MSYHNMQNHSVDLHMHGYMDICNTTHMTVHWFVFCTNRYYLFQFTFSHMTAERVSPKWVT